MKKGRQFLPIMNFTVKCTGYVAENPEAGSSDGFLFQLVQKNTFASGEEDNQPEYRLVFRDGIETKISKSM